MNTISKKILASGLAALTLAGALAAPAQAKPFPPVMPKPFPIKLIPLPKPPPPQPWPHHHHGFPGWGIGLLGGIALGGALAASATPAYDCGVIREAVVNRYGVIVGYRYVSAC